MDVKVQHLGTAVDFQLDVVVSRWYLWSWNPGSIEQYLLSPSELKGWAQEVLQQVMTESY